MYSPDRTGLSLEGSEYRRLDPGLILYKNLLENGFAYFEIPIRYKRVFERQLLRQLALFNSQIFSTVKYKI